MEINEIKDRDYWAVAETASGWFYVFPCRVLTATKNYKEDSVSFIVQQIDSKGKLFYEDSGYLSAGIDSVVTVRVNENKLFPTYKQALGHVQYLYSAVVSDWDIDKVFKELP